MMKRGCLALLLSTACGSNSYADQPVAPQPPGPRIALAIAGDKVRAPYDVQLVRENGDSLPTYAMKDRFYVQGNAGERYTIRVTNPTDRRVEAVVAVDGLDVVDGDEGDVRKRGYIVPPHGEVRIEGFRTSLDNVATFRFSSVDGSYAGKKGKARNVGVIAVAIFEEQAQIRDQEIVVPEEARNTPTPRKGGGNYDYTDDLDSGVATQTRSEHGRGAGGGDVAKASPRRARPADKAPAGEPSAPAPTTTAVGGYAGNGAPARPSQPPPPPHYENKKYKNYDADDREMEKKDEGGERTGRLGLGTEFGEQRYSGASYTRFVRSNERPIAIAELRYNDAAGLVALGIQVQPLPDSGEIMMRETADPFPGDRNFSRAP